MPTVREEIAACASSFRPSDNPFVASVIGWISYMGRTYGGTCFIKDGYECSSTAHRFGYDWGQALAYQQFGPTWNDLVNDDDLPNEESWRLALEWAEGTWPEWAVPMEKRTTGGELTC